MVIMSSGVRCDCIRLVVIARERNFQVVTLRLLREFHKIKSISLEMDSAFCRKIYISLWKTIGRKCVGLRSFSRLDYLQQAEAYTYGIQRPCVNLNICYTLHLFTCKQSGLKSRHFSEVPSKNFVARALFGTKFKKNLRLNRCSRKFLRF